MKHALFVVFHYPPEASSSGVLRTLKFSRYLQDFGWRVTVLTLRRDAYAITDEKLAAQIPESVRVVRTGFLHTKRHLSVRGRYPAVLAVPDAWIGWYPWAIAAGRKIIAEDPVDLLFSTSPHPTAHLIARTLSVRFRVPHVVDFRDPWCEEPPEPGTPTIVHRFAPWLERKVVTSASHIVTSTTELREMLRARYPEERPDKFTEILNGYDEEDFAPLPDRSEAGSERMLIVHAGNINASFRDPCPIFKAIARAGEHGRLNSSKLLVRFIGGGHYANSERTKRCVEECGLTGSVEFLPRVPYDEALVELSKADLLLLLQASEDTVSLVPAKLYEYLRSMRPVLALVLPGATTEVFARTGGGWVANPRNEEELENAVVDIFRRWQNGTLKDHHADLNALRQFDRRDLTGQLARVFDTVASRWAGRTRDIGDSTPSF